MIRPWPSLGSFSNLHTKSPVVYAKTDLVLIFDRSRTASVIYVS